MANKVIDIIANLSELGVTLTRRQIAYLKWRKSAAGKRYFSKYDDNQFYKAVEQGDVDMIDVAIYDKQTRINKLRKKVGLSLLIFGVLIVSGCNLKPGNTVPGKSVPSAVVETLTKTERSYTITDLQLIVDGDTVTLPGEWHVVSKDFIRIFRRNQNTTIEALEAAARIKGRSIWAIIVILILAVAGIYSVVFFNVKVRR